jgi:putative membrane protein
MAARDFFTTETKAKVAAAIKAIEAQTSAEVVVAVRHRAASYREAAYLFGFLCAVGALGVLLFARQPFALETIPLDVVVVFALGAFVGDRIMFIERLLSSGRVQREALHRAACAAFVDVGISRTKGRNGILVFASMLERGVAIVPDVGIDPKALGEGWSKACAELAGSLQQGADLPRFLRALEGLGPVLAKAMPHMADDVNELPDEMA